MPAAVPRGHACGRLAWPRTQAVAVLAWSCTPRRCCPPLNPRSVTAHYVPVKDQPRPKTVILMKFADIGAITRREQRMPSS
jgi:hypothetical protein